MSNGDDDPRGYLSEQRRRKWKYKKRLREKPAYQEALFKGEVRVIGIERAAYIVELLLQKPEYFSQKHSEIDERFLSEVQEIGVERAAEIIFSMLGEQKEINNNK